MKKKRGNWRENGGDAGLRLLEVEWAICTRGSVRFCLSFLFYLFLFLLLLLFSFSLSSVSHHFLIVFLYRRLYTVTRLEADDRSEDLRPGRTSQDSLLLC